MIGWQYHIDTDPELIGFHFLALSAGYVVAAAIAQRLLHRVPMRNVALASCVLGIASLLGLALVAPPAQPALRIFVLAFVGGSGGLLATSLLYILEPNFASAPAILANRAGALFGSGCLIATAMMGATYFAGSVQIETALLALAPVIFLFTFASNKLEAARKPAEIKHEESQLRDTLRDLRSVAAVLFSLLLFFQMGNEWAIAGWLPLFLIHRLGANPVWAIFALAAYFAALLVGRLLAQSWLRRLNHRRLLLASGFAAVAGYLFLSLTQSMPEAWVAVLLIGFGFAPIYPVVAETLDDRFSYHPGFYNGLFSMAMMGAMLAPWALGYVDSFLGMRYVMLLPAFGSVAVLILALLIMLESHVMGGKNLDAEKARPAVAGRT